MICLFAQIDYPLDSYQNNFIKMNINTIFLLLLVIAAYSNLYLTFHKIKQKKKTKLPISSKEWRERIEDDNFKSWVSNRKRLEDKR
tara:strand:+ start:212 stop:469 length:258 start_codon:yes stop_codon:yes gene_type:complete